jgi:glycosyltransferase involved in cell wall biosynthesis
MLAIIIPFYKLTFFEATLQSLANQTDKRFKVYIGDDASSEDCTALLQKFQGQFDFDYHRFETNLGGISLTEQWGRCIALSDDEQWLMILGDDDMLGKNVVEEFYKQHHFFQNINVIRYASQSIDNIENKVSKVFLHSIWETASNAYFRRFKGETRSSLSEYIFTRKAYNKFHFKNYPLAWHSDDMAWIDFSDKESIYSINEGVVLINFSDSSLSGMNTNLNFKREASVQFYRDMVRDKLSQFSKKQSLDLLMRYEVEIKGIRKVKIAEWLLLLKGYIKNFQLILFLKLIRRILISMIG